MRICLLPVLAVALLFSACSTPERAGSCSVNRAPPPPEPYVRVVNSDSNLIQLQIAVRKFIPARHKGPVVWLTGVAHIGELNYYAVLQKHLDAQTLVLFEGITDPSITAPAAIEDQGPPPSPRVQATAADPSENSASSLQSTMASSLGLVFQLHAINYSRPQFRNSDLSVQELRELLSQPGPGSEAKGGAQSFERLMQAMQGGSLVDSILQFAMRLLGTSPRFQAWARLALIDVLDQIQGDPAQLRGLPPEINQLLEALVQKRNEKVLSDLTAELKELETTDSVAVFYGTGHMPNLERRLRGQLRYRPAGEMWLTVFSVDLAKAGISQSERDLIHSFVKSQMNQLAR